MPTNYIVWKSVLIPNFGLLTSVGLRKRKISEVGSDMVSCSLCIFPWRQCIQERSI